MSGLGFHCFTFSTVPVKASLKVRNGRFLPQKYRARTSSVRAQVQKSGNFFPELMIKDFPYIDEAVERQSQINGAFRRTETDLEYPEEAYERCRIFCAKRAKMVVLGARLLPKEQQGATLALYAWFRRLDDLVDSPDDNIARSAYLDQWEDRTMDIFNGRPHDMLDAAVMDTLARFPLQVKLFQDTLKGMRMDTIKSRYTNFEELFFYCYLVTGTVSLMGTSVAGIPPELKIPSKTLHDGAVYFGIAIQLTNILKDVSDDALLGRVYLPQDELAEYGLCDEDVFSRKVSDEWKEFMKKQIQRARFYYDLAEQGFGSQLHNASSIADKKYMKVWSILMGYSEILDEIEENDYDNFDKEISRREVLSLTQKCNFQLHNSFNSLLIHV